jgi:hypothetical protein
VEERDRKEETVGAQDEKIRELYEMAEKSKNMPPPKQGLLGSKCPGCGKRLSRERSKESIYSGEDGSEFAKEITDKAGFPRGISTLSIERFTCSSCNYDFVKATMEAFEDDNG